MVDIFDTTHARYDIGSECGSWDESQREWFLAVPVELQVWRALKVADRDKGPVLGDLAA